MSNTVVVTSLRELDALVAEHVMGWRSVSKPKEAPDPKDLEDYFGIAEGACWLVPHYSTDIAAAWQVVEKIYADGHGWMLVEKDGKREYRAYRPTKSPNFAWWGARSSTPEQSICLAALRARGVEVELRIKQ